MKENNVKILYKGTLTVDFIKQIKENKKTTPIEETKSKEDVIKSTIDIIEDILKSYTSKEIKVDKKDKKSKNK